MKFENWNLTGKNLIACKPDDSHGGRFTAGGALGEFEEASLDNVERALEAANTAFPEYRRFPAEQRAAFLNRIGEEIQQIGDDLLTAAHLETALPVERLAGERTRTIVQIRSFADLIREGSWVDARIDRGIPDRKPLPKPDIRRMLIPIGPVVVFGASNFPLAFSVAGGDTASALAAGCPVVVKAHPAHPATSELVARAVIEAGKATGMPPGVFSLVQSTRNEIAVALVQHSLTKAVGFTGSLRAGRALFNVAAQRPDPIPVFAEMGSANPVFLLPGALSERFDAIAEGLKNSITLGVGQFCTCPGVSVGIGGLGFNRLVQKMEQLIRNAQPATMLYPGILHSYQSKVRRLSAMEGVQTIQSSAEGASESEALPTMFETGAEMFVKHPELREEVFGPSTVVVRCGSREEMESVANHLEGQLTATIHGTAKDLSEFASIVSILENKVGRLIFNGFPTGVEVCASMQHGGPYPATTDARTTSVGTAAILRFARPVAYQNFPQTALPVELQDDNPRGIWRLVDGETQRNGL